MIPAKASQNGNGDVTELRERLDEIDEGLEEKRRRVHEQVERGSTEVALFAKRCSGPRAVPLKAKLTRAPAGSQERPKIPGAPPAPSGGESPVTAPGAALAARPAGADDGHEEDKSQGA